MPTAIWGESEPLSDDSYPLSLLKQLLAQMMERYSAQGACLALYDEHIRQMVIRLHLRAPTTPATPTTHTASSATPGAESADIDQVDTVPLGRRRTAGPASPATPTSATGSMRRLTRPLSNLERLGDSSPAALFPLGEAYSAGQGLIGVTWRKGEPLFFRRDDLAQIAADQPGGNAQTNPAKPPTPAPAADPAMQVSQGDTLPICYLALPILGPPLPANLPQSINQPRGQAGQPAYQSPGVIVLYQNAPAPGFHQKQIEEAVQFAERIGLYIQNDHLRRAQADMHRYIQRLQQISAAFPSNVILSRLVEEVYRFVLGVVPASSVLITLYDRDTRKMYDVFAVDHGQRIEALADHPVVSNSVERRLWWKIAQEQQRTLLLSTSDTDPDTFEHYHELLRGTWGDQTNSASFLLIPMKMFTRVIGSLSISSKLPGAFTPEKITVLETMVQLITVSIENTRLYDRSRRLLQKAQQHEESLAAMNSALLTISTVLNLGELLQQFVEMAARLVQSELSTFFRLSPDGEELVAQTVHDRTGKWRKTVENAVQASSEEQHIDLIEMIRLPFRQSVLAKLTENESFFYLDATKADELVELSSEGGAIFLREALSHKLLMIPVRYQTELIGILAVHTASQDHGFRPEDVSTLLAISAQTASAMRNAQLFEQISMANAELRRMDKLKDEFIVTASHELRTPLSAISGYASLLKRQSSRITSQQALRYASKIGDATQQLIALVQSMTDASKIGAIDSKMELKPGPVQLSAATDIAMEMVGVNIEQKISVQVDPALWVYCDAMYLRQVLTNLLDNAAKYSPPTGQIIVSATATALSQLPEKQINYQELVNEDDQDVVLVHVCDEGDGIPLEEQERIFEKFVRAPRSLTTPVRGSGLGLYICRRYIEVMGGKLWLEMSIPGEGSIFSFYLPRIEAPIPEKEMDESDFESEHEHEPA
jgi:signal transduction histidine kinase